MESGNHSFLDLSSKISSVATSIKRMKPKIYEKVSQEEDTLVWMNHPTNSSRQIKTGWLRKQGGMVKSWHRRWFVLNGDCLFYFAKEDDLKPLGTIYLPGNKIIQHPANPDEPDKFLMEVVPGPCDFILEKILWEKKKLLITGRIPQKMAPNHETFLLCAATDDERQDWVKVIRKVMFASVGGAIFGSRLEEVMEYERKNSVRKVPYIVEACIDFITQHGLDVEGIFRLPGRMLLVRDMKDRFDEGESVALKIDDVDVHSVASLLKQYLRELPECLIPYKFYQAFMNIAMKFQDSKNMDDKHGLVQELQSLMVDLPQVNYSLLKYLCQFLNKVASYTSVNKMTVLNLSTVFGPNIIRHPQMDDNPEVFMLTTADISQQLVYMLINYCDEIFTISYDSSNSSVPVDDLLRLDETDNITSGGVLQPMNSMAPTPAPRNSRSSGMRDLSDIVFEQRGDRRARSFQSDVFILDDGLRVATADSSNLDLKLEPVPSSPKSADTSPVNTHQPMFTDDGKPIPPLRRKYTRKKQLTGKSSLESTASSEYSGSERSLNSLDDTDARLESSHSVITKPVSDNTPNTVILELQQKLETMNAEYESLQVRYDHLNASKSKSDERVKTLSSQMGKIQTQYDEHIRSLEDRHKGQVEELCKKLEEERSRLDHALKKVVELQTTVKDYELHYGSIKNKLPPLYQ